MILWGGKDCGCEFVNVCKSFYEGVRQECYWVENVLDGLKGRQD